MGRFSTYGRGAGQGLSNFDPLVDCPERTAYVKMAFVFAGLFVLIRMRRQIFENPQLDRVPLSGNAKMLAWASLACWFGAITSGRLLAYVVLPSLLGL
jgi:hypothetical protein